MMVSLGSTLAFFQASHVARSSKEVQSIDFDKGCLVGTQYVHNESTVVMPHRLSHWNEFPASLKQEHISFHLLAAQTMELAFCGIMI